MENEELTRQIIGAAYAVQNRLGSGFLESVYEAALTLELGLVGLKVETQWPLLVYYKEQVVGRFVADMVVENSVIVELKAVEVLARTHEVQLVNYLKATGINVGLLLNFGPQGLVIKRKHRLPAAVSCPVDPAHPVILS